MNFPWIILSLLTILRLVLAAWGHLSETESYLLLCSHHLDWGFVEGPAGIPALMRLSEVLFGNTPLAIRWFSPVFLLGSSWVLWKLTVALYDKKRAFWTVIAFNLLPLANAAGTVMEGTMLVTFSWLTGFYLGWELITQQRQKNKVFPWVLFGLILAVGTQATYQIGWLLPIVMIASLDFFHNALDVENLSSKSTDAATNCVVPVLASSSIDYTLSRCAPSTPCSSQACNSLAPARLAPTGLPSAVDPAAATPHVLATLKTGSSIKPLALLNDDSNPVGEVHLGVVHQCELLSEDVTAREEAIAELGFFTDEELQQRIEEFESWSQIVIRGWRELQH